MYVKAVVEEPSIAMTRPTLVSLIVISLSYFWMPVLALAQNSTGIQAMILPDSPCGEVWSKAKKGKPRTLISCGETSECWEAGGACILTTLPSDPSSKGEKPVQACLCKQRVSCSTIRDKETCKASACGTRGPGRCEWTVHNTCQCSTAMFKLPVDNS